jgi:hypothetical protein
MRASITPAACLALMLPYESAGGARWSEDIKIARLMMKDYIFRRQDVGTFSLMGCSVGIMATSPENGTEMAEHAAEGSRPFFSSQKVNESRLRLTRSSPARSILQILCRPSISLSSCALGRRIV